MLRSPLTWVGLLLILLGVVWLLQGPGYVGGSAMTGETLWAIVGPTVAVAGLGMVVAAARKSG